MKRLLDCKPDIKGYLESIHVSEETLALLGINADEQIKTLKDLTDLMQILKSLKGAGPAKEYIDRKYEEEAQQEALSNNKPLL